MGRPQRRRPSESYAQPASAIASGPLSLALQYQRLLSAGLSTQVDLPAQGSTDFRYVGPTATGSGSGLDWANVASWSSVAFTRGLTYYLKSGTYNATRTLGTATQGSLYITIKKATASDHGTDTGWSSAFGTGQAYFTSQLEPITINTSNWIIDGNTRNEANWFDGDSYGIRIDHSTSGGNGTTTGPGGNARGQNIRFGGTAVNNVTVTRCYCYGIGPQTDSNYRPYTFDTDSNDIQGTGIVFSRNYINRSSNVFFIRQTDGCVIEYNACENAWSNGTHHGEIVNVYFSVFDTVIRHNVWRNSYQSGLGGTALIAVAVNRSQSRKPAIFVYGNVFDTFYVGDAAIGFLGNPTNGGNGTGCVIVNNTFIRGLEGNAGIQFPDGSGNTVRNNLWIGSGGSITAGSGSVVSHNAFSNTSYSGSGTNAIFSVPTSIFQNYAGADYHIASTASFAAGIDLAAPYDIDMDGVPRVTGNWTRGAYQRV
jgi:hypothetical protein